VQNYQYEEPTCATEDDEELLAEVHISVRLVLGGLDLPVQRVVGRGRGWGNKMAKIVPVSCISRSRGKKIGLKMQFSNKYFCLKQSSLKISYLIPIYVIYNSS